jgi:phenylacetate-coenzyme A ligase PaaK-like adenylate-forming protein
MPFIRYKVGDIGKVVRSRCPCGNPDDVIEELDGRINDYIQVNPDKSVHSSFIELIMTIIYTKGENLLQYQLIQHTLKEFTLKLCFDGIKDKKFVEDACYRWFKGLMGSKFRLTIDYVTNIRQNSKTGKFQYFISELIKP